ncbi:hypothetical protein [Streptomyces sp. NPDC086766]|uniref:hypothetical protein n=1 Tax=Streptomyces sp. NPDC086766 TaxID=3365754 RepID=UPI003800C94E
MTRAHAGGDTLRPLPTSSSAHAGQTMSPQLPHPRLHAFFATLYYCGPRPEEAVAMRVEDVTLPGPDADDQWCELLIHTATPEVGSGGPTRGRSTNNVI